jgi:hypothetical protein
MSLSDRVAYGNAVYERRKELGRTKRTRKGENWGRKMDGN